MSVEPSIAALIAADKAWVAHESRALRTYNTPSAVHRLSVYIAAIEAVLTTCDELEDIVDDEGIFSAATIQIRAALAAVLAPSTEETK